MLDQIKNVVKKSHFVHSAYKLARDARAIPLGRWLKPSQIGSVFRVLPETMLPMPRLFDVIDAVETINKQRITGDIVECGVWNGGCVGLMGLQDTKGRKIHLFDSFAGLPQPSPDDTNEVIGHEHKVGEVLQPIGACVGHPKEMVERFLTGRLRLDPDKLQFHVGWFQETIPDCHIKNIAILRIDGDWYESTKTCLEGLFDKVTSGGFVIIDDYGTFSGCKKAVDEFFSNRNVKPDWKHSDSDCIYFRKAAQ